MAPTRNVDIKNNRTRWGDWLSAILLIICMQLAAGRLVATRWTDELHLIQVIVLFGTFLGLALGKSIFNRFWVIFLGIAYGMILIPWQIGLALEQELEWLERLKNLWGRLSFVSLELISQKPVTDNILFILLMAILFWGLSVYAGYILVREANPWKVVIPGGIAAFVIHSFDPLLVNRSWYIAFYLFFALLLVARLVYLKNTEKWQETHTHTPPDLGFDFTRVAIVFSLLLVFFAWNVPVLAQTFKPAAEIWQTASRPWLSAKDRFGFMFASLRASVGLVQNFYGTTLPLGLGSALSDQVILEVEAPTNPSGGYRFYWKARNYDTYEANQWQTGLRTTHDLSPESLDLNQPGAEKRPQITSTFFPHLPISNLYAAPEPLWVNRPTQANLSLNPDGTINFGALMSKGFIHPGEQYTVRSAIDSVSEIELRNAGTDYPQWVQDEYLQLSKNTTPRTIELAKEIAEGKNNPYDIAYAVTEYLRNNIEYTQTISQPPSNQERIDWFLFDTRKGFCNYYASAEVILLRSLGIPARMAVGFAQGERQTPPMEEQIPPGIKGSVVRELESEISTYVVRQKDAHAWPEVFFPGYGWVIFEPTVSQPALFRPSGEAFSNADQNQPADQAPPDLANELNNPDLEASAGDETNTNIAPNFWTLVNIIKLTIFLFSFGILLFISWQVHRGYKMGNFMDRMSIAIPEGVEKGLRRVGIRPPGFLHNWISYRRLPALSRSYMEINSALKRLKRNPSMHDTPSERTVSLIQAIPTAAIPANHLLAEYQTSTYSPRQADEEVAHKAAMEIRNLSWLARLGRLLERYQEPDRNR